MDNYIEELLAEMPDPEGQQLIDLDDQVPSQLKFPADPCVEILNDTKVEFEVDGATVVFSLWRVETEDPLDIGDIEIAEGIRDDRLALDARMTDARATRRLTSLPEDSFLLRIKFLRERAEDDWAVEDKFDPVPAVGRAFEGALRGHGLTPLGA